MATQNLPSTGQTNWGDTLNKYLSVSTNENGGLYTFETEAERDAYFDGSTMFKTLDEGKTCVIKTGNKIQKREGTSWVTKFEGGGATTGTTTPGSGDYTGQTFYNTTEDKLYVWDGSQWKEVGGGAKTNPNDYTADPADYAGFIQPGWKIGGGIVFWTDGTNGLIAAPEDEAGIYQWKTSDTATAGTTSLADGYANTQAMITAGISLHPAAQACVNKSIYGFSDWYLASAQQLHFLCDFWWPEKNLQAPWYWSSTEHNTTDSYYISGIVNGVTSYNYTSKTNSTNMRVRAIRSF